MSHCVNLSEQLTAVTVTGNDAARFLQGQLTCDVDELIESTAELAMAGAWCNPKGRVITTLYVMSKGDALWLAIPQNIVERVINRLRMFVLRADVSLDIQPDTAVVGRSGDTTDDEECERCQQINWFTLRHSTREISVSDVSTAQHCSNDMTHWQAQRIFDGEAFVDNQTTEELLPEHLNLDLNGAVSFTKGCFPGQEVVARMHYKGKQKTRLFIATVAVGGDLNPGAKLVNADGKAIGSVVESVKTDDAMVATITAPSDSGESSVDLLHVPVDGHDTTTSVSNLRKPVYSTL